MDHHAYLHRSSDTDGLSVRSFLQLRNDRRDALRAIAS